MNIFLKINKMGAKKRFKHIENRIINLDKRLESRLHVLDCIYNNDTPLKWSAMLFYQWSGVLKQGQWEQFINNDKDE